jgi:hypothetical protein
MSGSFVVSMRGAVDLLPCTVLGLRLACILREETGDEAITVFG